MKNSTVPAASQFRLCSIDLGRKQLWLRLVLGFLLVTGLCLPAQAKRIALVIGNDAYQNVPKLSKAGNDAGAMARELTAAGFEVQVHRDLNYRGMVKAVETLAKRISGGDEVLVFFAGHGVQIKTGSYMLPVDIEAATESEVEKTAYGVTDLTDKLSEAKAAFALVVVDACRDNPLKSSGRSVGNARGLSAIEPPKGQMVVYSASRGQQALDRLNDRDTNPNGVFTREFISRMRKPGLKIEDLVREVQDSVEALAQTVRHEQRPAIYNEARGIFYFYGPTAVIVNLQSPTSQEPIAQSARPGQVEGFSLADLEREEATRKEWGQWQSRMKVDFDKTTSFVGSPDLVGKAWDRFLITWAEDNPNTKEDDLLRQQANVRREAAFRLNQASRPEQNRPDFTNQESLNVTLAHVGPTTGAIAHLGKDNERGAMLAVEELNARGVMIGGKKANIRLITEDDSADPGVGVAVAQKLVNAKVSGVVGHLNSGTSIPASRIYSNAGIPQISPSSTNPKYTRQGFKTTFRLIADDLQLGRSLGRFAVSTLHGKSVAIIDDRTAYGKGIAEEFAKSVADSGGSIVSREYTSDRATDFSAILLSIKSKRPDLIFFGGMDAVAGPMLRQMQSLGISAKFMGGDGICSTELVKLAGDAITDNQVFCAEAGGVQGKTKEGMEDFKKKFKSRFGAEVLVYAPYTYDSVKIMVAAMVIAGSSDPEKYLPELASMKGYFGVTGPISFDPRGDIINGAITLKVIRGGVLQELAVIR